MSVQFGTLSSMCGECARVYTYTPIQIISSMTI